MSAKTFRHIPPPPPNKPAAFEPADASALQALADGTANETQQKRALTWIINNASAAHGEHFYENDRLEAFALGRAYVGQQILGLLKINLTRFNPAPEPPRTPERQAPEPSPQPSNPTKDENKEN